MIRANYTPFTIANSHVNHIGELTFNIAWWKFIAPTTHNAITL
jgi:hypothetical protein